MSFNEECGIFGIFNIKDSVTYTILGLHALQHRGQESAGIITSDSDRFHMHKTLGLVSENFNTEEIIKELSGNSAIGHVRYSTTGDGGIQNIQPLSAHLNFGEIAIAHNGNLTNTEEIKQKLIKQGCLFQSSTDTEIILHLIAISKKIHIIDKIKEALQEISGAYSLVIMTKDAIFAIKDPLGIRPLCLGKINNCYSIASESTAFDINGGKLIRELDPGEILRINNNGLYPYKFYELTKESRFCIFEYVYFSKPDSIINQKTISEVRKQIGMELAEEAPVDADIIIPIPDSGVPAAIGYANYLQIPFDMAIIRNHYVGRTFIEPSNKIRNLGVKLKHLICKETIKDKKVVLIDDSIVRGNTAKKITQMIRKAGAKEVHFRIACPPIISPCFYGIDTPDKKDLISANMTVKEIEQLLDVDSLKFLSIKGLYKAINHDKKLPKYCDACLTERYPVK